MATRSLKPSIFYNIKGVVWKLKTFLFKCWISLQDRFGWYTYQDWIADNELHPNQLRIQENQSIHFQYQPVFSCLLGLNDVNIDDLERTLTSLASQTYAVWEAFIYVTSGDIDQRIHQIVEDNPRIRLLNWKSEAAIFINGDRLNARVVDKILRKPSLINGEFLFFLQAGDTVSPSLLFQVVENLNQNPDIDLFYTDEDHLTYDSHIRHSPFFKPDWSPELLYSTNYLRFSIIRASRMLNISAKSNVEMQYDELVINCADEARSISHIAEVMIHFQDHPEPKELEAQKNRFLESIMKRLQRMGLSEVEVQSTPEGAPHLTWQTPQPLVSIIIPTRDCLSYLQRAIESIRQLTTYSHYELVIVDNESRHTATHQYYELLARSPDVHIVQYPGGFNFSASLNIGASHAQGDIFLFLNNDIQVIDADWLTELVQWALLPDVGIVGARLLYPDGKIQHAGLVMGMEGHANHIFMHSPENTNGIFGSVEWYRNYSAVTGACMAMRRDVFDEIGGFNTDYQLAFSDIEVCLQAIQHGYRVVYNPFARLIHYEGRTRSHDIPAKDIETGFYRFRDVISHGDPFYNPNLSYAIRRPTFRRLKEEPPEKRLSHILNNFRNI